MNIAEFKETGFHADMWVIYEGERKYIISVSFPEALLGLCDRKEDTPADEWTWVRCESVEIINEQLAAKGVE